MSGNWTPYMIPLLAIAFLLTLGFLAKRIKKARAWETLERIPGRRLLILEEGANFFGVQSRGMSQVRGNGVLALTDRELYFLMWLPKREFVVPLSLVRKVSTPKSFLGRAKGAKLLRIDFEAPQGADAAAWLVRDPAQWVALIKDRP